MYKDKKILALILARSGSKGLPNKNIKILNDKPLITWTIEAALNSKYIDECIVSTDGKNIADISEKSGAYVPFIRPKRFAMDNSSSFQAIDHTIGWCNENDRRYDILILLEPTSPLRTSCDVDEVIKVMVNNNLKTIVTICTVDSVHPNFLFRLKNKNTLVPYTGLYPNNLRRQDIESLYFIEGSIYCSKIDILQQHNGFLHDDTKGYLVPKWKSFEIDDEDDFLIVEALMKAKLLTK